MLPGLWTINEGLISKPEKVPLLHAWLAPRAKAGRWVLRTWRQESQMSDEGQAGWGLPWAEGC